MKRLFFICLITLCRFLPLTAGWIVQQEVNGEEQETLYIQDQKIKIVNLSGISILDLENRTIAILNPQKKTYFLGPPEALKPEAFDAFSETMKEGREALSGEDSIEAAQYGERLRQLYESQKRGYAKPPEIEITEKKSKEKAAGHRLEQFDVFVDGQHLETLWICPDIEMKADLDVKSWLDFLRIMSGEDMNSVYLSDAYIDLMGKGFPLKSKTSHGTFTEVKTLTQKNIRPDVFSIPPGYKRITYQEMIASEIEDDN